MALCLNLFVRKPGNHQHHLSLDPLFQHRMRNTQGFLLLTLMYTLLHAFTLTFSAPRFTYSVYDRH